MIQVVEYSDKYKTKYSEYIAKKPQATIYHTLEWKSVIEEVYSYQARYLIALDQDEIVGCLPVFYASTIVKGKRFSAIPFSHYVPVLVESEKVLGELLLALSDVMARKNVSTCEFRAKVPGFDSRIRSWSENFITSIDLRKSEDELWSALNKSSIRKSILKAKKSNVLIDSSNNLEAYKKFYELQAETRKKQGAPMYSRSFFDILATSFAKDGLSQCYIAKSNGKAIAGLVVFNYGDVAIYGYGGSLSEPDYLRLRPNHLLMWHAILESRKNHSYFDLGSTPEAHETLLRYKNGWGGKTRRLYYNTLNVRERTSGTIVRRNSKSVKIFTSIIKILPARFNKLVGPILLRQIG